MEILFTAFVKATGWSIINSLWQGVLIYIVLLLLFAFNPRLEAKTKHNMSFMALLAMFCWFSITFFSEFNFWVELNRSLEFYYVPGFALNGQIAAPPLHISLLEKAEQSFPIIVFLYSTGLLIQITMLLLGYLKVRQLKTKGLSELPENLLFQFAELTKKLGLSRIVKFNLSSKVNVPMVVGYLKPVVLIPVSILSRLGVQQLEAVIIHELSHIRRNDYMLNLIKISIETILFFNPFVWLCSKLIETEREHACDDLVLQITGQPLIYASTLLQLERMKQDQNVFSMAITGKKFHLLNRIKRMTEMKTSTLNIKVQLFSILILSAVVLSLAWIPVKEDVKKIEKEEGPAAEVKDHKQETNHSTELQLKSNSNKNVVLSEPTNPIDTLKKQFKIMVEDENGKQAIYNSLEDMPEDLRLEFLDKNRKRFAMPVFHFGNGVKGFNGFTMRAAGDSTLINKINVNGKTIYSTKGFYSGDSVKVKGYSYFIGDSGFLFRDTSKVFGKGTISYTNGQRKEAFAKRQALHQTSVENMSRANDNLRNASENVNKANALTIHGSGKNLSSAKGAGSQTLTSIKNVAGSNNLTTTSLSRIPPLTKGFSTSGSMTIGPVMKGTPEERAAMVKKILENKENRERIAKSLLRPGYRMNPQGQLEEDLNSVFVFDDVAVRTEDILKVIRPGLKNDYGIYIPTKEEKLQKLIENPANKEELRQIISENPSSRFGGFGMNGRSIYKFEEALVQKSDILEYLQRNQKAKQSLMKD